MKDSIVPTEAIEPYLNNWHRIQTIRQRTIRRNHPPRIIHHSNRNRRGTTETSTSPQGAVDSNHSCYKFENGKTVWGNSPEAINERSIYRYYGGNINGLKPSGEYPESVKGFHIDGSIDGSIATYTQYCGMSNILSKRHAESGADIPNTHLRGSTQIDLC
jgi:hypothetical protein